jgi:hypothetical protein
MKTKTTKFIHIAASLCATMFFTSGVWAEEKADKTGTNPINFTHDFRVYHDVLDLESLGDAKQNVTTVEFRAPILDGKWQFRTRFRFNSLEVDLNNDGINEIDDDGVGTVDMRFLTVPYLNMKERKAVAVGLEIFLPTGNDITGSQTLSLGPQVFGVFFAPFGISNSLMAPAVQYKFSIDEEDGTDKVEQYLFDVFFLKTFADKQYWMLINPQFVIDQEQDIEFGFLEAEFGMMLDRLFGTKGHSVYIRPSVGYGGDAVTESSFELGYKIIW